MIVLDEVITAQINFSINFIFSLSVGSDILGEQDRLETLAVFLLCINENIIPDIIYSTHWVLRSRTWPAAPSILGSHLWFLFLKNRASFPSLSARSLILCTHVPTEDKP